MTSHMKICKHGVPGGSMVKNPSANAGDVDSTCGSGKSSGEGKGNSPQRNLAGYSQWGCKWSDMT